MVRGFVGLLHGAPVPEGDDLQRFLLVLLLLLGNVGQQRLVLRYQVRRFPRLSPRLPQQRAPHQLGLATYTLGDRTRELLASPCGLLLVERLVPPRLSSLE